MRRIRCCIVDPKRKYRGIDREIDMRLFNNVHDNQSYQNVLDQYLEYLACEEEYTPDNLSFMAAFVEMLNCFYVECEIVLYSTRRIDDVEKLTFLGIDIIDQHMKSVLKERAKQLSFRRINQFGLFLSEEDANNIIQQMNILDSNCNDLFFVYSYRFSYPYK